MDDEPAVEIEVTESSADDVAERRARVRAVLDGHPVAAPDPPAVPPRLELLR